MQQGQVTHRRGIEHTGMQGICACDAAVAGAAGARWRLVGGGEEANLRHSVNYTSGQKPLQRIR